MSQKTIKSSEPKKPVAVGGVPPDLLKVPDVLKLQKERGNENYTLALQCLLDRFANSEYAKQSGKSPHQLLLEGVHSIIDFLGSVFPRDKTDRPLGVPEVAFLFGAVIGHAAAPAMVKSEVGIDDINAQVELLWIATREWLVKAFMAHKHLESVGAMRSSKLIIPPGIH